MALQRKVLLVPQCVVTWSCFSSNNMDALFSLVNVDFKIYGSSGRKRESIRYELCFKAFGHVLSRRIKKY